MESKSGSKMLKPMYERLKINEKDATALDEDIVPWVGLRRTNYAKQVNEADNRIFQTVLEKITSQQKEKGSFGSNVGSNAGSTTSTVGCVQSEDLHGGRDEEKKSRVIKNFYYLHPRVFR